MDIAGVIKRKNIPFHLDEQAFYAFVDRVTDGKYTNRISVTQKESESGFDEYTLTAKNGKITITATSGVSAGSALNAYFKKYCRYYFGILTKSGVLPDVPPDTDGALTETSVFHYRYAFNYCTFGYTYAFNDWKAWERVSDYLILSGYNLVLNPLGNECVWLALLQNFGYTYEEAKNYISAPNYLPWQWMMNISAFESEYPDSWFEEQKEISRKFNKKLKEFGMSALMPGYCGAVPDDFATRYPNENILNQGYWEDFVRPAILLPDSGLFAKIATTYYTLQKELLQAGDMHYYSTDPFHEGGNKGNADLQSYAKAVLSAMKETDKDAVWAFQGWQKNPDRTILSALDKADTLVMNLHADLSPDGGDDFLSTPHIYCVVNNFGGEQAMRGSAEKTYYLPHKMASDKNSACAGIGMIPEGVECDEVLFDLIGDVAVLSTPKARETFLREYISARYGIVDDKLIKAYEVLFEKIYTRDIVAYPHESGLISCPSPEVSRACFWAGKTELAENEKMNAHLISVLETLLTYYDECKERESYVTDLVAIARQLIGNVSWRYIYGLNNAFEKRDKKAFQQNAEKLLALFPLQEAVVDCDKNLNLQLYLDKAQNRAHTQKEKEWFTRIAKRLITLWSRYGARGLHDYAPREYGDMLRAFYKPRWVKYIQTLEKAIESEEEFTMYPFYDDEYAFVINREEYTREISTYVYTAVMGALNAVKVIS